MAKYREPDDPYSAHRMSACIHGDQRVAVPPLPTDRSSLIKCNPCNPCSTLVKLLRFDYLHRVWTEPKPGECPQALLPVSLPSESSTGLCPFLVIMWMKSLIMASSRWRMESRGEIRNENRLFKSPMECPQTVPIVDGATQTVDLTKQIRIPNQNVVCHGGFSDIYCGQWEQGTDKFLDDGYSEETRTIRVAVKLLRVFTRRGVDLERARKRLNREVNVWKRLDHPNIAKFYGVSFQLGGRPALVMQWYEKGTAPNYIKDLSMESRLTIVKEVCAGLKYLHTLYPPVVHGDLKGNNILVDDEGHPLLSDFGLSRVVDELEGPTGNTTTTLAGTVRWQAPELLFDEEEGDDGEHPSPPEGPTLASDVWSLGCTIYELLSGHIPYHHRLYDWKVIQDVMQGVSPLQPEDVMIHQLEGVVKILKACWASVPDDRPSMSIVESRMLALSVDNH